MHWNSITDFLKYNENPPLRALANEFLGLNLKILIMATTHRKAGF